VTAFSNRGRSGKKRAVPREGGGNIAAKTGSSWRKLQGGAAHRGLKGGGLPHIVKWLGEGGESSKKGKVPSPLSGRKVHIGEKAEGKRRKKQLIIA